MSDFFATPRNPLDAAARAAFRRWCNALGGPKEAAFWSDIDARTAERIYQGKRDVPPGLARTIAELIERDTHDQKPDHAVASAAARDLRAWADDREQAHG